MDTLIIEYGIKHGRAAELIRSKQQTLNVGRSYDNDLVLNDLHIAPKQLQFYKEEEQWYLSALDQTNPVLFNGNPISDTSVPVKSGDKVTIGRTHLSLYASDHPVAPTRKLILAGSLQKTSYGILLPIAALLIACVLSGLLDYVQFATDLKWKEYVSDTIAIGVAIIAWASVWSLIGKLLRHQHHFGLQLIVTSVAVAVVALFSPLSSYLEYITSSSFIGTLTRYALEFIPLVVLLKLNLQLSSNIHNPLKAAIISSAAIVMVTYGLVNFSTSDEFNYSPEYSTVLKPPFAKINNGRSLDEYFNSLERTIAKENQE